MAGIVGLTELQHTSGNSAMTITTSGDVNVKGEGSATTNLRQGLIKTWTVFGFDDAALDDSFNTSSITDVTTAQHNVVMTNAMGSAKYSTNCLPLYISGHGTVIQQYNTTGANPATTTTVGFFCCRMDTGANAEPVQVNVQIAGDLA